MSEALKFTLVTSLAALSAVVSAETILMVSHRLPELRAAEAATSGPIIAPMPVSTPTPPPSEPQAEIRKASDGHYWAQGEVNGASVRFLVDTGATAVALTPGDARRLGFDLADLKYGYTVTTAAGQARAAAVKLAKVTVGGATLTNVDALIIDKGLDTSLLGMTYLGRLASFQATRETLILKP
ncbi:TIGR02281 family clan AA aspartic protease [Phenylobacterium sp.]|uniref:TIGR02281 family clan AA aspartic protease n=1 Tax=Phenylobacterium sp. TaxID=1871053 RepID=UPI0012070D30|nr:TIGR02281 family clan AA aspartic protease [Phenylobacterium sp.]THD61430.1 MAG: TIGR02281 family clan AA aspartic protease [Phenylobacterium sp.]